MDKPVIKGNTITVPSKLDHLADVDLFIEGILRGYGTDESLIADIAISVSELVNNAVSHGNQGESDKIVSVSIEKTNGSVSIAVTDEGGGFNPGEIANPVADENLLKDVGRGIFIVNSLMDTVETKKSDKGTTVVITKSLQ
ncbi:MAG: ATP-binding protein [bacterium]|nr:ATP-binding protein [bacterium]